MSIINFDLEINRKGTASLKWDLTEERYGEKDLLPMWVADMDFASPVEIVEALTKRAAHPVYGYTAPTEAVYNSAINWMKNKHNWEIQKEWITFSAGVVSGFTTAILAYSEPGDKVLIQTPVYTPFFDSVKSNDRVLVENQLKYEDNTLKIDFDLLESQLQDDVKLFLLCSPHNPGGMVWTREDLQKIGELCVKYNVVIISDEIHADLCLPGFTHYPIASLSEDISNVTVTLMAPSKTFNVAGIQASLIICENKKLQQKLNQKQHQLAFHGLNLFALEVITASYDHCNYWLEEAVQYIQKNVETVQKFVEEELPHIKMIAPEASYLIWLDCRALGLSDQELKQQLIQKGKIAVSPGVSYGKGGEGFIRLNVGCTHATVIEGLKRLKLALT
ncbi:pyridoxal phosphate-dependent aminotransferase [Bacillus sp. AGMB 02131]|uniref:cysteine-S-conjugate beta-lyase n=1 Tax=Peribacillus faecalis TaxID=2772559 RepID=A0A927CWP3_9BACI|nr:MalY/PatB family protein [Peribacillus faecalis]MBD3109018.1 pyridoxal phosphate-dependent aminotransferase [Peribacillus faecalis]